MTGEDMDITRAVEISCSFTGFDQIIAHAMDHHLFYIHRARQIMVRRLLPPANDILDLGGANSPLYQLGYGHAFKRLVMVDLPPDERHENYQDAVAATSLEGVSIRYCDMTRLDSFEDESFDLVWSGQSIEHVEVEAAQRMCREAWRVLRPNGAFCLDTPNRLITKVHTSDWHGGFVHPDHKYEYTPMELQAMVQDAGFKVEQMKGICAMPETYSTQKFQYTDFILGNPITDEHDSAYITYLGCRKPL